MGAVMKSNYVAVVALALAVAGGFMFFMPRAKFAPEAKEIIKAAEAKAEAATKEAEILEANAAAARPRVRAKKEALQEAAETRIASNINLDGLPMPMVAEFDAMAAYITALESQLEIEKQRGDRWRDAAMAQLELVTTLTEQNNNLIKAELRRGLKWGAAGGAAAVILLVVLL
jgi:hypothetical protein